MATTRSNESIGTPWFFQMCNGGLDQLQRYIGVPTVDGIRASVGLGCIIFDADLERVRSDSRLCVEFIRHLRRAMPNRRVYATKTDRWGIVIRIYCMHTNVDGRRISPAQLRYYDATLLTGIVDPYETWCSKTLHSVLAALPGICDYYLDYCVPGEMYNPIAWTERHYRDWATAAIGLDELADPEATASFTASESSG